MLFYALRVLMRPRDPDLFSKGNIEKDISHFEKAIEITAQKLHSTSATPSVHKKTSYTLKLSLKPTEGVMAGVISRQQKIKGHDKDFREFDVDNYPPIVWIWDREEQVLLVEKKTAVFKDPNQVAKAFEDLSNNDYLAQLGLRVFIEPCLEMEDFWSEYHNLQFIDKVSFTLVMPNIFGKTKQALSDDLRKIEKDTNANAVTTTFENRDGNLKLKSSHWASVLVDWVKDGGGSWLIKGRKTINSKSTTVTSNQTAKIVLIEGEISEIELNGYSSSDIKDIIALHKERYTFKNEEFRRLD
ncbi:TPA: hypothetical protein N5L24_000863 [Enterobacter roggenkampii]|uniref:hypothetical protein n=1 Tax=Enterobacter roggenkampii TaxID=1812935 RepID=UPI0013D72FD2|nr:hypothetical protein [Enterobacter roggenkampii]MDL0009419.1 hypothetical protein [Enterobacter roggenkampii]MED5761343.1 hypothetical protein [Enterobacter roggenkampii]HCM9210734.1 hypothetical protein [Enterobacter roggenkampii]HCU1814870.1 hypothetical protein [Enterobacter cloacae]